MPLYIKYADITTMDVDAIVNAANSRLAPGGGVCGAIFAAADARALEEACLPLAPVAPGQAVATPSFGLKAPWIIHAVGPVWRGGSSREAQTLASCYHSAMRAAAELGAKRIAFPLISSGIYGFPPDRAQKIARTAILEELEVTDDVQDVYLCLWSDRTQARRELEPELVQYLHAGPQADKPMAARLASRVPSAPPSAPASSLPARRRWPWKRKGASAPSAPASHEPASTAPPAASTPVTDAQAAPHPQDTGALFLADQSVPAAQSAPVADAGAPRPASSTSLEEALRHLDQGFSERLLALIDERHLTDAAVYRKAGLTRQHFSKIRSNPHYQPRKQTVLALAFALELTLPETQDLLSRAGFALNPSSVDDAICTWYLEHSMFDIDKVNRALFAYDRRLLGA